MAYSDPTLPPDGFEGFTSPEKTIDPKNALGFEGFVFTEGASGFRRFPVGFEGFTLEFSEQNRFIQVTDFRGNPLAGAQVTVQNTGGDFTQFTDILGIASVVVDVSGTKTVLLKKDKTNLSSTFTYSTDPLTKVIVLQPRLL
jgi:hypothetical protein